VALLCAGYVLLYFRSRKIEMMQRIEKEQMGLLTLASHQIGEAIVIFEWSLESIKDAIAERKTKDIPKYIEHMDVGIQRLNRILEDLHRARDVERGNIPYTPTMENMRDVIDDAVRGCTSSLKEKEQTVSIDADDKLRLRLDRSLIRVVLRSLVQNASDFSPAKSNIRVSATKKGKEVMIEVEDHGAGIPASDVSRIFGKFARAENAHLSRPDGLGLGLFIARRIIEKAGGSIWIESTEGKGTHAFFTLPLA
jgi:signal transduction histidine kinase